MNLTKTLLKAGALYAIGRFASNVSADDVARVTGISGDDLKRYGIDRTDALLGTMGLQRQSTVPSSTALVLSGFAAGAIVGAGVTFLFYSEQGKDVRQKVADYFSGGEKEETETGAETTSHAGGNGEAKATA
jgi:hypothetical protein